MSKPEREYEHLSARDSRAGKQLAFGGVAIELIEVNEVKHPFSGSTFTVCYRLHDNRINPPFISDKAHLFVSGSTNLIDEFRKVKVHYEKIKSSLRLKT